MHTIEIRGVCPTCAGTGRRAIGLYVQNTPDPEMRCLCGNCQGRGHVHVTVALEDVQRALNAAAVGSLAAAGEGARAGR